MLVIFFPMTLYMLMTGVNTCDNRVTQFITESGCHFYLFLRSMILYSCIPLFFFFIEDLRVTPTGHFYHCNKLYFNRVRDDIVPRLFQSNVMRRHPSIKLRVSISNNISGTLAYIVCVCASVLRFSRPNGVMSSAVSLLNYVSTGQTWPSMRLTSIL